MHLPSAPTVRDIIARSAALHPSLLADAMRDAANVHGRAFALSSNVPGARVAQRLSAACAAVAHRLDMDPPLFEADAYAFADEVIAQGMDAWISTVNVARRLQCLSHAVVDAAVTRTHDALFVASQKA